MDIITFKDQLLRVVSNDGRKAEEITTILRVHGEVDAQTLVSVVAKMNEVGVKMILNLGKDS